MTTPDLAFYNAGTDDARGLSRQVVLLPRRLARRLLRPIFLQLAQILQYLCIRLDAAERAGAQQRDDLERLARQQTALAEHVQASMALGWDHVALVRRLAVLEDRVERLTAQVEAEAEAGAVR
jgi:hypothetical protein